MRRTVKHFSRMTPTYQCHQHLLSFLVPKILIKFILVHWLLPLKLKNLANSGCKFSTPCPWLMWHITPTILHLHNKILFGLPTYPVFSVPKSRFNSPFHVLIHLHVPMSGSTIATFHRTIYILFLKLWSWVNY